MRDGQRDGQRFRRRQGYPQRGRNGNLSSDRGSKGTSDEELREAITKGDEDERKSRENGQSLDEVFEGTHRI